MTSTIKIIEGDSNTSGGRGNWEAHGASKAGRDLLGRDERVFIHQTLSTPCLDSIIGAEGSCLIDADGRRILDFHGNSCHQVGYGNPHVLARVQEAMKELPFSPRRFTNRFAVELAERLVDLAPGTLRGNSRVLLLPSGAAAVGLAVRIAKAVTGRDETLSFVDAFHGATTEAASLGGQELFVSGFGSTQTGSRRVPPPASSACQRCANGLCNADCAAAIEQILESQTIAALVAEPVRATSVHVPPNDFWKRIREACTRTGTLLVFDEIPTGLGRSGAWWACERFGVEPDVLVIGKGLGGALIPQAAVIARAEYNEHGTTPLSSRAIGHFTHEKSPLGAAAACAVLDIMEQESLPQRAHSLGTSWAETLREELSRVAPIREIRQFGLMLAIVVGGDQAEQYADAWLYEALRRGLSFKIGGSRSLVLFPPLTITKEELDCATSILREAGTACYA